MKYLLVIYNITKYIAKFYLTYFLVQFSTAQKRFMYIYIKSLVSLHFGDTYEKQHPRNKALKQSQIPEANPLILVLFIANSTPHKLNKICILSSNINLDCARKQFSGTKFKENYFW